MNSTYSEEVEEESGTIRQSMNKLRSMLQEARELLEELEKRTEPILKPPHPARTEECLANNGEEIGATSTMMIEVQEAGKSARSICVYLNHLIERIEL